MSDNARAARPKPIGADFIIPALAVAFTAYFFTSVWDLNWEAKANATVIGVALLALIGLYLVRAGVQLARGEATLGFDKLLEPRWAWGPRLAIIGLCIVFIYVLPWLGLTLGLFCLTAALMFVLRAGSWRSIFTAAACVSLASFLLFMVLLSSRLPRGPVERLLLPLLTGWW